MPPPEIFRPQLLTIALRKPAARFEFVPGAVEMDTLGPHKNFGEPGLLGSDFTIIPTITRTMFLDGAGNCLCRQIGWIQIAKGRLDITMGWFGYLSLALYLRENYDWTIDGGIPYLYNSLDPVNHALGQHILFNDQPGSVQPHYWFGSYVTHFVQDFETHLVCLSGREIGAVYGGYQWGHYFRSKVPAPVSPSDYTIVRWKQRSNIPSRAFRNLLAALRTGRNQPRFPASP